MKFSRRNFVKSGALFVPTIFVPRLIRSQPFADVTLAQPLEVATAASCSTVHVQNSAASDGDFHFVGESAGNYYSGQGSWDPEANISICKINFVVIGVAGNVSGKTYVMQIWSQDGGGNLSSNLGTSDGVTGNNSWSTTDVEFTFSTPVAVTSGTLYSIVLTANGTDGSNFIRITYTGSGQLTGIRALFNSAGTLGSTSSADAKLTIFK